VVAPRRFRILICRGPECGDHRGSAALHEVFRSALEARGARDRVELAWQSCFGRCTQGPNVLVRELVSAEPAPVLGTGFATPPGPRGVTALYNRMDAGRVDRVIEHHVIGGQIARELIERPGILHSQPVDSSRKDS
jgi:(2Fe-2S) ferredoxin